MTLHRAEARLVTSTSDASFFCRKVHEDRPRVCLSPGLSLSLLTTQCVVVSFKVSPNLTKYWSTQGRGADSSLSDSCAIASCIRVWTRARSRGSLTGVRTALLPLIHATRAPTQGTALLQVSPTHTRRYFLTWTWTVKCEWYAATCPTRWPRSFS